MAIRLAWCACACIEVMTWNAICTSCSVCYAAFRTRTSTQLTSWGSIQVIRIWYTSNTDCTGAASLTGADTSSAGWTCIYIKISGASWASQRRSSLSDAISYFSIAKLVCSLKYCGECAIDTFLCGCRNFLSSWNCRACNTR